MSERHDIRAVVVYSFTTYNLLSRFHSVMLPPLVRSLRTQSSDENSHSSSSSDHSGVVTVVTTSTCLTTTSAEVGHHHGDSRNRNQDSSETGNQDSSGTGNQDSSGNGNQDTSTQAGADEISMEYIGMYTTTEILYHRFYRLRNRDWKRCVSREWSVLRAKCILFDARLPGVRTKTLLLYRYRACGGCYSQIKVPDRRQ